MIRYNAGTGNLEFDMQAHRVKKPMYMYIGFRLTDQEAFEKGANFLGSLIAYADHRIAGYIPRFKRMADSVEKRSWEIFLRSLLKDRDELCHTKMQVLRNMPNIDLHAPEGLSIQEMRQMGHYLPSWFVFDMMKS